MSLRHFSAVNTLNGKSAWRNRKCRFSVTRQSAPAHSVYAAIKASAGFRPFASYWKTISRCSALLSFDGPKANIYSFESMMMSNFFLPELFSCFSQSFYNIFFAHFEDRRRIFCYNLSQFFQMFFSFFYVFSFHNLSPLLPVYYKAAYMSRRSVFVRKIGTENMESGCLNIGIRALLEHKYGGVK